MQSAGTTLAPAQDHTVDAAKNYPRKLGGRYIVMVEAHKVATAVLMSSTKSKEIACAAKQLA